jgi:hypothetical protein
VQEPALPDPAALVDQGPLHDRDLPGGPAEGLQRDGDPGAHRRAESCSATSRVCQVVRSTAGLQQGLDDLPIGTFESLRFRQVTGPQADLAHSAGAG